MEKFSDLEFMQNPDLWSERPNLALRRGPPEELRKTDEILKRLENEGIPDHELFEMELPKIEYGFLIEGFGARVFVGNIHEDQSRRHINYDSLQAILADGWEVD